tara:strand:- start:1770 stop:2297 length:528 start_codon:yes stop_codon:yes gene_type:complete
MGKIFLIIALFFSLNSNATLDERTWCDGRIIHWNLYQINFEPFNDGSEIGQLEFWMGFHRNGSMIPNIYWYAFDKYTLNTDVTLFTDQLRTYLDLSHNTGSFSRGCFATLRIEGTSSEVVTPTSSTYAFTINGSGFISRDNSNLFSDADYFTLNNALITYGGLSKWGKLTFTQIR